jgi:hypothetical protein
MGVEVTFTIQKKMKIDWAWLDFMGLARRHASA